ncbi:hypothetical protein CMUS01_12133 [Colletotrichum musicola]|uniref:Uncharacterized protein n=1 Tax=Colletotrichum musicola TaxID=2175873 RepID=A0A8H6JQP7_9PEZI|nr:hypothetical protein CMUS01_12133 [Colletotrichum musicola]
MMHPNPDGALVPDDQLEAQSEADLQNMPFQMTSRKTTD